MVLHHLAQTLGRRLRFGFPRQSIRACCRAPATTSPAGIGSSQLDGRGLSIWTGWKNLRASRPGAVAVMAANNETGVLQPWRDPLLCRQHEVPLLLRWRAMDGKEPAHGLGECEYVSGWRTNSAVREGWDFSRCRAADDSTHSCSAADRKPAARRHGKRRWRPFNDRGPRES